MAIQDVTYNEVRIRQGSAFQQIPNYTTAGEALADGQFIALADDGEYYKASPEIRATHIVQRSGVARVTPQEIVSYRGIVQQGEPVMAFTGSGTATIPFAMDVHAGDQLTVDADGYAIGWYPLDGGYEADAYIVGHAINDVTISEGETLAWGDAFINLPAQFASIFR